jgi:hypothetical protein
MGFLVVPLSLLAFGVAVSLMVGNFPNIHIGPKYYDKEGKEKKK